MCWSCLRPSTLHRGMGHTDGGSLQWGRYQAGASVMMALLKMPAAWFQLSILFLSPDINFRCDQTFNESIPLSNFSEDTRTNVWDDSCTYENGGACERWEYDRHEFQHTVNMMWNLVCDRGMYTTWSQLSLMSGVFCGNLIGGFLADRVGRKPVLVCSVIIQPLMSGVVAITPWFSTFVIFRFLLGLSLGGTMVISFVLGAELGAGPWRPVITILHQVPFGMGQTFLALTAYFLRDWREVQMALSVYCLIFFPYCWLIEESPKWLVATGRIKQAERVAAAIRRRNGIADALHTEMRPMAEKNKVEIVKTENNRLNNNQDGHKVSFCCLFRSPRLCHYTLAVWVMWYCAGLSFFALNAYQPTLGSSSFINIGIGGLVGGIPGNIVTIFLVRRFGRKKVIIIGHILVSLLAILIPIYDVGESTEDWQRRLLGLFTLMAMSVAYPALFLLSGEILPTVVRATVMGVANLMARLGNTTAPLVGPTAVFHKWLPLCIIAGAPLITVLLMLSLPETNDGPLPDTVEDIETKNRWPKTIVVTSEENGKIYKPVAVVADS